MLAEGEASSISVSGSVKWENETAIMVPYEYQLNVISLYIHEIAVCQYILPFAMWWSLGQFYPVVALKGLIL